eukprot:jgi/Botrbrau1/1725/Bobra.116_2s0067.1
MSDKGFLLAWPARGCWMVMLVLTLVYIFYSAPKATPHLAPPRGLEFCFFCGYGLMWHIFLLTIAFPVAMVEGYLTLSSSGIPRNHKHYPIHLLFNTVALVTLIAGLVAVVGSKIFVGREHFYTAHAWVGGLTMLLSAIQFVVAVLVFRLGKNFFEPETRSKLMVIHRFTGKFTVIAGIMSCVVGWADLQQITSRMGQEPYSEATMIGSSIAVLLTVLLGIICYIFTLPPSQRPGAQHPPLPPKLPT